MRQQLALLWVAACVLCGGCNRAPQTVGMRGEVTFDGRPVQNGKIDFLPIEGTKGASAGATISNGKYEIAERLGPRVDGVYQVQIIGLHKTGSVERNRYKLGPEDPATGELQENFIPLVYNVNSTLTLRISEVADKDHVDFHLRP